MGTATKFSDLDKVELDGGMEFDTELFCDDYDVEYELSTILSGISGHQEFNDDSDW